ncbi:proteasome subunit beta type-7 [Drosophila santomea]|uniref:proteasome subunit beta type-7 n=1 Tax=Drosophila santomea TaxID=129105 RepID=UPI0019541305|nr:proteasome subunit beta type-7 [Drosophila santomea]XP_039499924.1 proteasome subunit beta type-7 [Drosophila santomea]
MLFPFSARKANQTADFLGSRCGFNFVNCRRNAELLSQGYEPPKAIRTGTSIVGIIYQDGVILGADTRATEGPIVSDKNCSKIHHLQDHIYCCGAGTAADTEMMTLMTSAELDLHQLNTGRQVPVVCASMLLRRTLFRYQGHIGAALVMGGVDSSGPQIYCIYPCGSNDKIPYAAMGSGTLAAMSVLEHGWQPHLDQEQGKQLVREAISAGVFNDLGSGSNIDLCVITKKGAVYLRTDTIASEKGERLGKYGIKPNSTMVTSISVLSLQVTDERTYAVDDPQPGTSGVQGDSPPTGVEAEQEDKEELAEGSQSKSP